MPARAKPLALPALTGIRFVAAFLVLAAHAATIIRFAGPEPFWHICVTQLSGIGMPLFFVLSGFVIHYNYFHLIRSEPFRGTFNFFIARFARLYPMYLVILCLELFRGGYLDTLDYGSIVHLFKIGLPSYLLLVQSWYYQIIDQHSLIFTFPVGLQVTWSISTECFFYLCYPLLCVALVRLRRVKTIVWAIAAVVALGYASLHLAYLTSPAVEDYAVARYGQVAASGSADSLVFWLYYLSPYPRLLEFVLGALAAALFIALRDVPVSAREILFGRVLLATAMAAIVVVFLALFSPAGWLSNMLIFEDAPILRMYFTFAPFIAAVLFCCARYAGWIAILLSRPWIVLCGEASYSIYLIHMMIIEYVKVFEQATKTGPSRTHGIVTVAIVVLIVISVALVTYRIIEVPARRILRRQLSLGSRVGRLQVDKSGASLAAPAG
jgi:peptidoglycan/LPS O-acetylase OafA/YrhL